MNAKYFFEKLKYTSLSQEEAKGCMHLLIYGDVAVEQKSAILALMEARKPSVDEISGFADFVLNECTVPFETNEKLMDVCGTGGDGNNTLNISTLTALVLASAGIKIAKHGNYGVTSVNGSSGILEHFGYRFKTNSYELKTELEKHNVTFLHAPLFHPALKNIAPVRKGMQMKTVFNVLGPMVNPMQPVFRYTGVSNLSVARTYHYIYQQKNISYNIVHTLDGNDELTLTDSCKIFAHDGERLVHPLLHSKIPVRLSDLQVNSMSDAAEKFMSVLENKASIEMKEAVLVNAAFAYTLRFPETKITEAKAICAEVLENGKTKQLFTQLIQH